MKHLLPILCLFVFSCESQPPPPQSLLDGFSGLIEDFNAMYDGEGNFEGNYFDEFEVTYNDGGYILVEASPRKTPQHNPKIDRIRYANYIEEIARMRWSIFEARKYDLRIRLYRDGKKWESVLINAESYDYR